MPPSTNAPNAARLDRLTWPEAAAWFRRDPRLLLPVGTCLQHGPHLPLGADTIVVERLAEAVSEKTGILVAPTLAYGVTSDIERSYAGTAALERKTLHRVLNELVDSWERQGLEEIVLMTAHGYGPHIQAMAAVVADFVRVRAVDQGGSRGRRQPRRGDPEGRQGRTGSADGFTRRRGQAQPGYAGQWQADLRVSR